MDSGEAVDPKTRAEVEGLAVAALGPIELDTVVALTAGASRRTYRITGRERDGTPLAVVLQVETGERRRPDGMATDAAVMREAVRAGVPCPKVLADNSAGGAASTISDSYLITAVVDGESIARKILRDERFAEARDGLSAQLGRALGLLHSRADVAAVDGLEDLDQLSFYREKADELDLVSPAFELAFRYLATNQPQPERTTIVHGDFRLGNLLVDESGLTAVLDWELVHRGDPHEDLAWPCVRAWRFGGARPVAGLGDREPFYAAYSDTTGWPVDRSAADWWELLGSLKWGVMCGLQASRYFSGERPSVEMLAIGNRICEQEHDVLRLLGRKGPTDRSGVVDNAADEPGEALGIGLTEGGARPSVGAMLDAVAASLRADAAVVTDRRFQLLVAANAIDGARRDVERGHMVRSVRDETLAELGVDSERTLVTLIRGGTFDEDLLPLVEALGRLVDHRVASTNPRWLG